MSGVRKLLSFGLRKGSKMIQSTFFTAVAPAALMLTLAIVGGMATVPWKSTLTTDHMIKAAALAAVPFILDSMAETVQKSDYRIKLRRWAETFEAIADSIRKFNDKLEECIRDCTLSANMK